jgi:hypothetical protein
MNEPQPVLGYLLIAFLMALGAVIILSARKIVEFDLRVNKKMLDRVQHWHPILKFPMMFRLSIRPDDHVFWIRFAGAMPILFAMMLLGLAIRNLD